MLKKCTVCDEDKPLTAYHKHKGGHKEQCKDCRNAKNRLWNKHSNYKRKRTPNPTLVVGPLPLTKKEQRLFYKKRLKEATPKWVRLHYAEEMKYLVTLREDATRLTGEQHHLDHVVPITHPEICGLNVPWNLQVIPATHNLSKGNTYQTAWGDAPHIKY